MLLRSPYQGSNIGDPNDHLTLQAYERESGQHVPVPIPVEDFIAYGEWVRQKIAVQFEPRDVTLLERKNGGFRLAVNGDECQARRVVVAAGIGAFPRRSEQFESLGRDVASHTLDHHDLSCFGGRRVSVVGGGQSALESAALLHEAGAHVDVLVRAPVVRWLAPRESWRHRNAFVRPLLYARPDVGPAFVSHVVATPGVFPHMPRRIHDRLATRSIRPAGAAWLRPRLEDVGIRTNVEVVEACATSRGLHLRLSDGTRQAIDHLMFGTGYRVDVARYPFMGTELGQAIACDNGYPQLNNAFETSVSGLHILGAPAARQFGPLMRFVAGSNFAGRTLARGLKS